MSVAGFVEGTFLDPDAPNLWGHAGLIATKEERFHAINRGRIFRLEDEGAVVFAGTRASLSTGFGEVSYSGARFVRENGTGIALFVVRGGSKLHSLKVFGKSANKVIGHRLTGGHVGGLSNMYGMSKTYAKTYTAIEVAAFTGQQIAGTSAEDSLVGYWDETSIGIAAVFNQLVDCGVVNTGMVRRPSKLRALFSPDRGGGAINVDESDLEGGRGDYWMD